MPGVGDLAGAGVVDEEDAAVGCSPQPADMENAPLWFVLVLTMITAAAGVAARVSVTSSRKIGLASELHQQDAGRRTASPHFLRTRPVGPRLLRMRRRPVGSGGASSANESDSGGPSVVRPKRHGRSPWVDQAVTGAVEGSL